jgi:lysophospholipase L1-like esterase
MEQAAPANLMKFLALGDSYTIGEAVPPEERWPVQLVNELRKRNLHFNPPDIIATTGWRSDELLDAISERQPPPDYDMVSILIGVNNLYQGKPVAQYAVEFEELLRIAIVLAKGKKEHVFVLSIPDYGFTPFGKETRSEISQATDLFNDAYHTITSTYGIAYFDITGISRHGLEKPELIASDNLHPSGLMYAEWVRTILRPDSQLFRDYIQLA